MNELRHPDAPSVTEPESSCGREDSDASVWADTESVVMPARCWSEWLPDSSKRRMSDNRRVRRAVADAVDGFDADYRSTLLEAIERVLEPDRRGASGLEVVLVTPEGSRHAALFDGRRVRIGADPACDLRLQGIAPLVAELRIDEQAVWLVPAEGAEVAINGSNVREAMAVTVGDRVEVGSFVLAIGDRRSADQTPFSLTHGGTLDLRLDRPVEVIGGEAGHWLRVAVGNQELWLSVPASWLRFAWDRQGRQWSETASPPSGAVTDVERGVLLHLLDLVCQQFAEASALTVEISSILDAETAARQMGSGAFIGSRIVGAIGGQAFEMAAVWAAPELSDADPDEAPGWALARSFQVSLLAGWVTLELPELKGLGAGDIVLPDAWLTGPPRADQRAAPAPVAVTVQNWWRRGVLQWPDDENPNPNLEIHDDEWRVAAPGEWTVTEPDNDPDVVRDPEVDLESDPGDDSLGGAPGREEQAAADQAPIDLENELEVTLAFELGSLSVPLGELSTWREGVVVPLEMRPDDSVKIYLRQASGARLVGYARVVTIDDQIGVRIERWLASSKGDPPHG